MKISTILLGSILIVAHWVKAQEDFKPGYLITNLQDTLHGSIDYRSDLLMGRVCNFRPLGLGKEVVYYPESILSYRFIDGKYFVSKKLGTKKSFFEYLFKGRLDILYLRDDRGDHYYLETANSGLVEIPYEEGIQYRNGAEYFFKSVKHIGLLKYYTKDAPQLQSVIERIDRPEHKSLIALAEKYHKLTAPKSAKGFYQKRYPLFKVDIEGAIGMLTVRNSGIIKGTQNPSGGILAHFWLPRLNERLYFRTGFLYSLLHSRYEDVGLVKIPVQLEYVFPLGRVQPKIGLGVNVHNPFFLGKASIVEISGASLAVMVGANVKLSNLIYLSANLDFDFKQNFEYPILPAGLFSDTSTLGLMFKF